jgi:hypothetical protein
MSIVCRLTSLPSACRGCSTEAVEEKTNILSLCVKVWRSIVALHVQLVSAAFAGTASVARSRF